jgi:pyruvate,water dikinase
MTDMDDPEKSIDSLLHDLRERAKELNCLYEVQELLGNSGITIDEILEGIIRVIPPGWQYPDVCQAEIVYDGKTFRSPGFRASPWVQSADIVVQDERIGRISVYYSEERPRSDEGPFLKEERKLINTIAEQLGFYILHEQLKHVFQEQLQSERIHKSEWVVILDLLKRTDPDLLMRITRKMINYLGWNGIKEVEGLLEQSSLAYGGGSSQEENRPYQGEAANSLLEITDQVFEIASEHLSRQAILDNIQRWSREERVRFLVDVLVNPNSSLAELSSAIERYQLLSSQGIELTDSREKWFRVSLIRRVVSNHPQYVRIAKEYIGIDDFSDFMRRLIFPVGSHGLLGGKSSGLFLAAQILRRAGRSQEILRQVKTPKTWYVTSDSVFHFMSYNDLEDHIEQKYRDLAQVRQDYPYIIHVFRNSPLPPEIVKGLSLALDDFGDVPLIVRSSSLLEDQTGAAFAGKYKSLFIANKGTKDERLGALMIAITEVFASMFGPDPIEYRIEHGLIDDHEEMGILIQEVVGTQVGQYYLPAFAGVAFSNNEFRWSSRIRREDGLVRLVPGLGTRAVDRLTDDYPVLISLRQPSLRVNATVDEILRYSPKKIDVINLESRSFETVDASTILRSLGDRLPLSHELLSIFENGRLRRPMTWGIDFEGSECVVTFDGLFSRTPFIRQLQTVMSTLQDALGYPIDIEFAHDGTDFYLLQCRSQSHGEDSMPPMMPRHLAADDVVFTANRYVCNGIVTGISHIVYVDPQKYAGLQGSQELLSVGRIIGRLNQMLPRRRFILMGPGRWGSRGDIRLGVSVSYSDINNTAMLIEIARSQKDYVPEPSFGTHFFQDLVEASIRYLPLYPDEPGIVFNERFFTGQTNILGDLLPEFGPMAGVVRVVDVPAASGGRHLQVLMNAETEEAVAFLSDTSVEIARGKGGARSSGLMN